MPSFTAIPLCVVALQATLAAAEPSVPAGDSNPVRRCAEGDPEVVVTAYRFGDGRSYAFMVTNNAKSAIYAFHVGRGSVGREGDTFIEASFATEPVSIGSPSGWTGMHVRTTDPRQPGSHTPRLIDYQWRPKDLDAWIQPGRSLSGFSVQLPTPREAELAHRDFWESRGFPSELPKERPFEERLPPQPDLTTVQFGALLGGKTCVVVGDVQLDRASGVSTTMTDASLGGRRVPRTSP